MITIVYGNRFLKSVKLIPSQQQRKLAALLENLRENPYHPLLHTKHLTGELAGFLSFRITREWRAIFIFRDSQTVQLLRVEHRKDVYR